MSVQVVKVADESWDVTRVTSRGETHEYELLGRVRLDGREYAVDLVEWTAEGKRWLPGGRRFLLQAAAVRWLERRTARSS